MIMNAPSRGALVDALSLRGIGFLDSEPDEARAPLTNAELIAGLATSPDPRLRNALALLFVRRPELAEGVPAALAVLPPGPGMTLREQYSAAVYLQHMWHTRLGLYLPGMAQLPDLFTAELGLPRPEERFGLSGLRALELRSGFNLTSSYDTMMALLFDQLRRERIDEPAPAG
jgi:hypothetical protein